MMTIIILYLCNSQLIQRCEAGDFVVCVSDADKNIYLGQVQKIGHYDDEVLISFMSPDLSLNLKMQSFHLPTRAEEV